MDENDFLSLLDSNEKPFAQEQTAKPQYNNGNNNNRKPKQPNIFERTDIKAVAIDPSKFDTKGKSFSIMHYVEGDLPPEVTEKFLKVSQVLFSKGYTYRAVYDVKNTLAAAIASLEGAKVEYYSPWKFKGMDENLPIKRFAPSEEAYGIGCSNHKIFMKLPNGLRARLAAEVHTLLGEDCKQPLTMLITYSESGDEALTKNVDFKAIKTMTFAYRIAGNSNIPIYNLKKSDAGERLASKIKHLEENN